MKRIFSSLLALALTVSLLAACGRQEGLEDGYYTAQAAEFSHGWKEYITIMVAPIRSSIMIRAPFCPSTAATS